MCQTSTLVSTATGKAKAAEKGAEEQLHVTIKGVTYDCTKFAKKHPGGSVLYFYNGLDATDAYQAFHYSRKPDILLKTLPVVDTKTAPAPGAKDPVREDFREMVDSWKARGLYAPDWSFWVLWCSAVVALCALGVYVGGVVGGIILGVAWAHCGFVQHHAGHMGYIKLQILFECFLKGGSARWWRNRHTKHHAFPNVLGKDGDLRTTPFLAWDMDLAKSCPSACLAVQHLTFLPLLALYVPVFFVTTKKYLALSVRSLKLEVLAMALHWALALSLLPPKELFVLYATGYAVQGVYLGFFFSLSHFHLPRFSDETMPWPTLQACASADWNTTSAVSRLVSGFLNLQIEHHFAPMMPPENLAVIAPEVKAFCKRHEVPYMESGFLRAAGNTFGGLHKTGAAELARRAGGEEKKKRTQ